MYEDNMKMIRRGFQKAGANTTDLVAIKRMMDQGATPYEISQKLLIKQEVIDSFFGSEGSEPSKEPVDKGQGVNSAELAASAPKTFKEVLGVKRK